MSIPNIIHKIKGNTGVDKLTVLYLFIIIGVGIGSFGLGRLSVNNNLGGSSDVTAMATKPYVENQNIKDDKILETKSMSFTEKRYVASKNGKMYYSLGCSGAKRIKPENEVWFSTSDDAEKAGYTKSTTCK